MGGDQISTFTEDSKKPISTFTDDFEEFMIPAEEVTADVLEVTGELELEVDPENVTGLLQPHDKT